MKNYLFILIGLVVITFGCSEDPIGQQPIDKAPPGPVSDVEVLNTAGGAILTYKLPSDEDLLYVKGKYSLKEGVQSESKASMYSGTLTIEGFGDTKERDVTLISVDRSQNESSPVTVTIAPLEPAVITIGNTLSLIPDFGGVHGYWNNPTKAEVSVVILKQDNNEEFVPIETVYSTMVDGEGSARGLDTIQSEFGIYVQDRWENQSETQYFTLTPIFETMLDPFQFKTVALPGDEAAYPGWEVSDMWDGSTDEGRGLSTQGGTGRWPHMVSMDLGVIAKLSRFRLFQRNFGGLYIYSEGNPRKFEIWGCETLNPSGSMDSWTLLGDFTSIKPSGLPQGQNTNEDIERATKGEDYVFSPLNPKVRYIRIRVKQTWGGGDNFQIMELNFFGDNRK